MAFPRIAALLFVFLLIGCLALACIGGVNWLGPLVTHGSNLEHDAGIIVSIHPNLSFVLETASEQHVSFQCSSERCRIELQHMQRHMQEHAHTDVYYVQSMTNDTLLAVDVD